MSAWKPLPRLTARFRRPLWRVAVDVQVNRRSPVEVSERNHYHVQDRASLIPALPSRCPGPQASLPAVAGMTSTTTGGMGVSPMPIAAPFVSCGSGPWFGRRVPFPLLKASFPGIGRSLLPGKHSALFGSRMRRLEFDSAFNVKPGAVFFSLLVAPVVANIMGADALTIAKNHLPGVVDATVQEFWS